MRAKPGIKKGQDRMRTGNEISARQQEIMDYIYSFVQDNGISPSIRDIQMNLNISSTSVVAYNLRALEEKGKLERRDKISRGIKLASTGTSLQIPLLGTITAGEPLPNPEETIPQDCEVVDVPFGMVSPNRVTDTYALRVRGQSMIDALIDDGDVVLIRFQETADNGDMVVARIVDDNAVTLKKFYHEGDQIRLQPANSTMEPFYFPPDRVQIQGHVVGVLRNMV